MSLVDLGKRLLEAAKQGNTDEVKALMSNGAPFTTDWLGTSPLHFAALYGHSTTAEVLIRAGISRDARTKVDRTPLHVSSQEGHFPVVELLVKAGADVDSKDMLKMTPLHWAVENGHIEIIELLLNAQCDMNSANKFDKTPMDIAICQGRYDVVELLNASRANRQSNTASEETAVALETVTETISQMDNNAAHTTENMVTTSTPVTFVNADEQEAGEQNTAVLATLAALAEATGPIDASGVPTTNEADTLKWLESHGITMISADNSTLVASVSESGQQLALTEAGKLALSQMVKTKEEPNDVDIEEEQVQEQVIETEQNGVIVNQEHIQEHIQTEDGQILVTIHPENMQAYEDDGSGEPAIKRIKMEGGEEVTMLEEVAEETQHTLHYEEDTQHLGVIPETVETVTEGEVS